MPDHVARFPIEIRTTQMDATPFTAKLWIRMYEESGIQEDFMEVPVPQEIIANTGAGGERDYWLRAPGWWSPTYSHIADSDLRPVFVLYPTGKIRGTLAAEPVPDALPEITIRFVQADDSEVPADPIPESKEPCALEGAVFTCEVPAGSLDVDLLVEGVELYRRAALRVGRGETVSLEGIEGAKP